MKHEIPIPCINILTWTSQNQNSPYHKGHQGHYETTDPTFVIFVPFVVQLFQNPCLLCKNSIVKVLDHTEQGVPVKA